MRLRRSCLISERKGSSQDRTRGRTSEATKVSETTAEVSQLEFRLCAPEQVHGQGVPKLTEALTRKGAAIFKGTDHGKTAHDLENWRWTEMARRS